jgi:uracil phosphoribosyltransferase
VQVIIPDHPLLGHKLTQLRDESTDGPSFRRLARELINLLAYEATRTLRTEAADIRTPVSPTTGVRLRMPAPLVVPVLRAGLGLLEGFLQILPEAEVGFLGIARDERSLLPSIYAERLPQALEGRQVFVLDPMLATGGTLTATTRLVLERNARDVTCVCLLASPEGIAAMKRAFEGAGDSVRVVTASIDRGLNQKGYIVPGLGDAGDRLYGSI